MLPEVAQIQLTALEWQREVQLGPVGLQVPLPLEAGLLRPEGQMEEAPPFNVSGLRF